LIFCYFASLINHFLFSELQDFFQAIRCTPRSTTVLNSYGKKQKNNNRFQGIPQSTADNTEAFLNELSDSLNKLNDDFFENNCENDDDDDNE
jgi:hypothetical protein